MSETGESRGLGEVLTVTKGNKVRCDFRNVETLKISIAG